MFYFLTRRIASKNVKYVKADLFKKYSSRSINKLVRLDNYSNVVILNKFNSPKLLGGSMCMSTNSLVLREKTVFLEQLNDPEKFSQLLQNVNESENSLSIEVVTSIMPEMISILDNLLLEDHHKETITKSEPFIKLLNTIESLVYDFTAKDLTNFLLLCKRLNVPTKIEPCIKAVEKLNNSHTDLSFYDLCVLWNVLPKNMNKAKNLRNTVKIKIMDEISMGSHLDSPDNLIGTLLVLSNRAVKAESWDISDVLKAILELEELNHPFIFQLFLRLLVRTSRHHKFRKPTEEQFFKRVLEEVTNNNFLSLFFASYGHAVSEDLIAYDEKLVDDVVNKMMGSELKAYHIKILCQTLAQMKHCHYGFVEYLISFMKNNPNIFAYYPSLSSKIIPVIASANCNPQSKNRWESSLSDLNNSPGLVKAAESLRKKLDRYLYFLVELASLEIFLDEELKYVAKIISDANYLDQYYTKLLKLFLVLDQAVTILYPNFSGSVLSKFNASLILKELEKNENETQKHKSNLLRNIGKSLEASSGVQNCLLMKCLSKSNVQINGVVGVNDMEQLLDFSTVKIEKDNMFIEDIASLTDYKLLAITVVSEQEISRNTMDLNPAWTLGVKIQEKLGYPTLIIYETIWQQLAGSKGNFLLNKIVQEAKKKKDLYKN